METESLKLMKVLTRDLKTKLIIKRCCHTSYETRVIEVFKYASITPPEWYRNVIFGGPGPWTRRVFLKQVQWKPSREDEFQGTPSGREKKLSRTGAGRLRNFHKMAAYMSFHSIQLTMNIGNTKIPPKYHYCFTALCNAAI